MKVEVRPLEENDLDDAERIVKLAFSAQLGLPDPNTFLPGTSLRARFLAQPDGVFGAFEEDELVGAIYAMAWGSFGFFGPLVVHPRAWGNGIGQQLLKPVMSFFDHNVRHHALFTFPDSPLHISLYQKFGYWPRFLVSIMRMVLEDDTKKSSSRLAKVQNYIPPGSGNFEIVRYSQAGEEQQAQLLIDMRQVTDRIYSGLDLSKEIIALDRLKFGDTLLLKHDGDVRGFAICHHGPGSEAETGTCYIKFAAIRPGHDGTSQLQELLQACAAHAAAQGAKLLHAGVSMARQRAYNTMRLSGFAPLYFGVAMHNPDEAAYNLPDTLVIDDWR